MFNCESRDDGFNVMVDAGEGCGQRDAVGDRSESLRPLVKLYTFLLQQQKLVVERKEVVSKQ